MTDTIYILGSGAIGFPLAAFLTRAGRPVVAVRTSRSDTPRGSVTVSVQTGAEPQSTQVDTISLAKLEALGGIIVVTAKSHANEAIARELRTRNATGPVVLLQNGVGVEEPFLEAGFQSIYRCVLYVTSQTAGEHAYTLRPVTASPIGTIKGDEAGLERCVAALNTDALPFRVEGNIRREVWKKAIINAAFNSICPLLEVDNGVFTRDEAAAALALDLIRECVALTDRLELGLREGELMDQLMLISERSSGQLISTLQDIRAGRLTEIEFLNLAIARTAACLRPPLELPRVELLGRMIRAKELQARQAGRKE